MVASYHTLLMKSGQCTPGTGFLIAILTMALWTIFYFFFSPVTGVACLFTFMLIFSIWGFYRYARSKRELFVHFASTTAALLILPFVWMMAAETEQTGTTGMTAMMLSVVFAWWSAFLPLSAVDFAAKKRVKRNMFMLALTYLSIVGLDFYMYSVLLLESEFVLGCLVFFLFYLIFYPALMLVISVFESDDGN